MKKVITLVIFLLLCSTLLPFSGMFQMSKGETSSQVSSISIPTRTAGESVVRIPVKPQQMPVNFKEYLINGPPNVVGVSVDMKYGLPVVQQYTDDPNFVYPTEGVVTQFGTAAKYGVVGLLAHDYLSGRIFGQFKIHDEVRLYYGNAHVEHYRIIRIAHYQALSPGDVFSRFINLEDSSRTVIQASDVFKQVYETPGTLVFQTCMDQNGNVSGDSSWGRIFIIAVKE